jgi:hypothetical protein
MTNVHIALQQGTNELLEIRDALIPAAMDDSTGARWLITKVNRVLDQHDAIRNEWEWQQHTAETERTT